MKTKHLSLRTRIFIAVLTFSGLIVYFAANQWFFILAEEQIEDLWFNLIAESRSDDRIVIIEIDDRTLDAYYPDIPLPRNQIALLLDYLAGPVGHARTIVLDLYFEKPDRCHPENDALLVSIVSKHQDNIVNAVYLPIQGSEYLILDSPARSCMSSLAYTVHDSDIPRATAGPLPLPELLCNSTFVGHIDVLYGPSRMPRGFPLVINADDLPIGALSLEGVRNYLSLPRSAFHITRDYCKFPGHSIPLDEQGMINIRYFKNPQGYQRYSMLDILTTFAQGDVPEGSFADKIVIIGVNSTKYYPQERSITPAGWYRANIYLHADVISNILSNYHLVNLPRVMLPLALIFTALYYFFVFRLRIRKWRVLLAAGLLGVLIAFDITLFYFGYRFQLFPIILFSIIPITWITIYTTKEWWQKEESLLAMEQELNLARAVQRVLLPQGALIVGGYPIQGHNTPARDIGGDLYDFIVVSESGAIVTVGDVSGKGISAALLMAFTQATIRTETMKYPTVNFDCSELITRVNKRLCCVFPGDKFITLFYAALETQTGILRYVNAGHQYPFVITRDGNCTTLEAGGLMLGSLPDQIFELGLHMLKKGEKVILYTDGISEAMGSNTVDDMYGEERLRQVAVDNRTLSARELVETIIEDVNTFRGSAPQSDDITLVVIEAPD